MGLAAILILRKIISYSPYFFTESDILIAIYSSIIWQDRNGSEYFLDRSAVDGGGGNAWEARRRRLSAEDRVYEMERRRFERSNRRMCEVGDTNRGGFGRRCLIRPNRISSGETSLGSFARRSGQCRLHEKPRVQGFHSSRQRRTQRRRKARPRRKRRTSSRNREECQELALRPRHRLRAIFKV